jgi:hypothetical protein
MTVESVHLAEQWASGRLQILRILEVDCALDLLRNSELRLSVIDR